MKQPTLCLILASTSLISSAQTTSSKSFDAAVVNHVYALSGDSLVSLESGDAHLMIKPAGPFGKSEDGYSLKGDKSTVRIKAADSLRFVIKTSAMSVDASVVRLFSLRPKKGNRDAVLGTHQDMYFHSKSEDNTKGIPFNVQKAGNDVYIIVPSGKLSPGEYAFMNLAEPSGSGPHTTYAFYAFGVDL
jgi:hypothetical protein